MITRNCETCGKERKLKYPPKTNFCASCAAKLACKNHSNRGWSTVNTEVKLGIRINGFKGKSHTNDTKLKLKSADKSYTKTTEFRNKMSQVTLGDKNPMHGKNFYDLWVKKYGTTIADTKEISRRKKLSESFSGEKNPMYGKPSPNGSGNGWSGWYKGWFFRSIYELSYMVLVIERFNLEWETAESKKFKILYEHNNKKRTYHPDFLINKKFLVEIKPKKLHNSPLVKLKTEAATIFCKENNLTYKLTYCRKLSLEQIGAMVDTGLIKFTQRYNEKFEELRKTKSK